MASSNARIFAAASSGVIADGPDVPADDAEGVAALPDPAEGAGFCSLGEMDIRGAGSAGRAFATTAADTPPLDEPAPVVAGLFGPACFTGAFLAAALLAWVFFAAGFLAGIFFAEAFFAGPFFAGGVLTGAFFAGAFFAGDFLAGAFLAAGFFAGAFLAGAFFVEAFPAAGLPPAVFLLAAFVAASVFVVLPAFLATAISMLLVRCAGRNVLQVRRLDRQFAPFMRGFTNNRND